MPFSSTPSIGNPSKSSLWDNGPRAVAESANCLIEGNNSSTAASFILPSCNSTNIARAFLYSALISFVKPLAVYPLGTNPPVSKITLKNNTSLASET